MATYTFKTLAGRVNIDAGTFEIIPPNADVTVSWNKADIVYLQHKDLSFAIHASRDTVGIDTDTYTPGTLTGSQLYYIMGDLFNDSNATSASTSVDNLSQGNSFK
jgi:hypothetical protein